MVSVLGAWLDRILAKPIRHLFETPTRLLKGHLEEGMTVLDVGSGAGYFSLGMARLVGPSGKVISVDTENDAIAGLRKKVEQAGLSGRIDARVCTEQDLKVSDVSGKVDFALAVYVIHHAQDAAALMSNVQSALRPGGKFLIIEPRHHASPAERGAIETRARQAGFALAGHPSVKRDWAAIFVKT